MIYIEQSTAIAVSQCAFFSVFYADARRLHLIYMPRTALHRVAYSHTYA